MDITIKASDGRLFNGTDYIALVKQVNNYEDELKVKKEKEEAARKEKEEKQKKLDLLRNTKLKEINELFNKGKVMVEEYEKETGNKLVYTYDYTTGKWCVKETRNSIDFAWDNIFDDVLKWSGAKRLL